MGHYIWFGASRYLVHSQSELVDEKQKYGIPELKKFPMPDAKHVRSAIKFFNYVTPAHEKQLANAILKRMREYGMNFDDFEVGEENRFSKYIPKHLEHHGILGMKWGIRRYQNKDGTRTALGKSRRAYSELAKENKNIASGEKPRVGKEIDKKIDNLLEQNKDLIKESKKIEKELKDFEDNFYHDKKAVQKAILDKWDKDGGILGDYLPNADKLIKEENGDITPSLLKLWNNKYAAKDAFYWYSELGDGHDKYYSIWDRKAELDRKKGNVCNDFSHALLGKYANKTVKVGGNYYERAGDIVTRSAIKKFKDVTNKGA